MAPRRSLSAPVWALALAFGGCIQFEDKTLANPAAGGGGSSSSSATTSGIGGAGGTGGGATGGGGAGATGGGGTTSSGALPEAVCDDCVDDDGDGKVDRDDEDCADAGGYTCLVTGSVVPFVPVLGGAGVDPPACEGGAIEVLAPVYAGFAAPPTECSCTCGGGATCTLEKLAGTTVCGVDTTPEDLKAKLDGATCVGTEKSVLRTKTGGCPPIDLLVAKPDPAWTASLRGCAPEPGAEGGCGDGATCIAPEPNVCVAYEGKGAPCPGEFPEAAELAMKGDDTRACGGCACTVEGCAGFAFKTYLSAACPSGDPTGNVGDEGLGECQLGGAILSTKITPPSAPPACKAGQSSPTGAVAVSDFTICCKEPLAPPQ